MPVIIIQPPGTNVNVIQIAAPTVKVTPPAPVNVTVSPTAGHAINITPPAPTTVVISATRGPAGPPGQSGTSIAAYKSVTDDYYVNFAVDNWIDVVCDSGDVTIWLPLSVPGNAAQNVIVKKADTSAYVVHVKTVMGQQIDNATVDFQINGSNRAFGFISSGDGYRAF